MTETVAVVTTVERADRERVEREQKAQSLSELYALCRDAPPSSLVRITLAGDEGTVRLDFASFIHED